MRDILTLVSCPYYAVLTHKIIPTRYVVAVPLILSCCHHGLPSARHGRSWTTASCRNVPKATRSCCNINIWSIWMTTHPYPHSKPGDVPRMSPDNHKLEIGGIHSYVGQSNTTGESSVNSPVTFIPARTDCIAQRHFLLYVRFFTL